MKLVTDIILKAMSERFEIEEEEIAKYIDSINLDKIIFRISVYDISNISDIIDFLRGLQWNSDKVLCAALDCWSDPIGLDVCCSNNITSYVVTIPTYSYLKALLVNGGLVTFTTDLYNNTNKGE